MKSDLIAIYAELTALNTYEKSKNKDSIKGYVNGEKVSFEHIESTPKETVSGYQGHIYRNVSNGDIIIVHEGSIPLGEMSKHQEEVKKDWYKSNIATLMGKVNEQFGPAEEFVDYAKKKFPNNKIVIVGQSLGGTLSELTGALDKNKKSLNVLKK